MSKINLQTESTTQLFYREVTKIGKQLTAAKSLSDYARLVKSLGKEIAELVQLNDAHLRMMASKVQLADSAESHTAFLLRQASEPFYPSVQQPDRLTSAGTVTLEIGDKDVPFATNSPEASGKKTYVKIPKVDELAKNYRVVVELHEKSRSLDEIASSLEVQFGTDRGPAPVTDKKSVSAIQREIQTLRTQVDRALNRAAQFLTDVARAHAPDTFVVLSRALAKILAKGLEYKYIDQYLYVFPNEYEEGCFTFCEYFRMRDLTDVEGKKFNQLFVVLSCTPNPATRSMNYRINTLTDMVAPSAKMLGKAFKYNAPTDARNMARALGMQLEIDKVANEYGRIPLSQLLKTDSLNKDLFTVEKAVHQLRVDNKSITFTFVDGINTVEKANNVAAQLNVELQAWARTTKARLRQIVQQATNGSWQAVFYYQRPVGFAVDEEDLEFLKERFNLDQATMDTIVETINKN